MNDKNIIAAIQALTQQVTELRADLKKMRDESTVSAMVAGENKTPLLVKVNQ